MMSIPPLEISGQPKIHILLATFNRGHLIGETLDSIINQTYTNWECFIVDDFSSDETRAVIEGYVRKDSRFFYYPKTEEHKTGLSASRNYGIELAQRKGAEFIQFFDDDDIMHPRKLEFQITPFLEDPNLEVVLCKYEGFTDKKELLNLVPHSDIPIDSENLAEDFLLQRIRINSAGPLFRSYLLNEERFDEYLPYGEERELFLRIFFKYRPKHHSVEEYLFFYRHHPVSITAGKSNQLEKIGANILIPQKLWDFLYENDLLTDRVAGHLLKQFLLLNYNKHYLQKVRKFTFEKKLGYLRSIELRAIIDIHHIYASVLRKMILQ